MASSAAAAAAPPPRRRVIDAWCQPAEASFISGLWEANELARKSGSEHWSTNPAGLTIDQHVKLMDDAGIEQAIICAWYGPNGRVLLSNERVAEYVRAYPTRFIGICSPPNLADPVAAVATIDHYITHEGFKGVRVMPWLWNLPPNHRHYWPIYVKCIQLDIPFCTQIGHTGPMCPSEPGRPIPYLDEVLLTFPKLKVIGGHVGYPWHDEAIALAWKYENFYIDTSAYLPAYYPPSLVHFMRTNGRHKVMFGSNFPQLSWRKCMSQIDALKLKPEARDLFLSGNAARVFKLNNTTITSSTTSTTTAAAVTSSSSSSARHLPSKL